MGAVESLDHCCSDRSEEKTNKKFVGSWRTPVKKAPLDLNKDCGNGAPICDEPLKDLKLDKSIDAEIATVFKAVGHRFPMPIHGQEQLTKILEGFRKRGYSLPGTDDLLCAKVWAMHNCSRITILQFRDWFQTQATSCRSNLHVLLCNSRYVSDLVDRLYDESEHINDHLEALCDVMNNLRRPLEMSPTSALAIQMTARNVIEKSGRPNYLLSTYSRGTILFEDYEALITELLVELYNDYFNESLYDCDSVSSFVGSEGAAVRQIIMKSKPEGVKPYRFPGASACCLPTNQTGIDTWRRVSESLPLGPVGDGKKSEKSKALPVGNDRRAAAAAAARSMKFPIGTPAAVAA